MKLLEQLHRWKCNFLKQGAIPAFIPLTREELTVVVSDCPAYRQTERFIFDSPSKCLGIDVLDSPFAPEMRQRQIELPITQIKESADVSYYHEYVTFNDPDKCRIKRTLTAHICHDTTSLTLTFEWDSLAALKRKLRITKWFPVRTKTIRIDGRVLYPHLKISLPHNRHHATFTHVQ